MRLPLVLAIALLVLSGCSYAPAPPEVTPPPPAAWPAALHKGETQETFMLSCKTVAISTLLTKPQQYKDRRVRFVGQLVGVTTGGILVQDGKGRSVSRVVVRLQTPTRLRAPARVAVFGVGGGLVPHASGVVVYAAYVVGGQ